MILFAIFLIAFKATNTPARGVNSHPKSKKPRYSVNNEAFKLLAERTGLEPATPGVTGRYSNQLNYHSAVVVAFA
jgi:hypothetical protein